MKIPSGLEVEKAILILIAHIKSEHKKGSVSVRTGIITRLEEEK